MQRRGLVRNRGCVLIRAACVSARVCARWCVKVYICVHRYAFLCVCLYVMMCIHIYVSIVCNGVSLSMCTFPCKGVNL